MNNKFTTTILATNWGYEGTFDQFCKDVKTEGYDGIEIRWPEEKREQYILFKTLKNYKLGVGFLCDAHQPLFKEHLEHFKKVTSEAANNSFQKPLYINCHSGRDFFSYEQNKMFIDFTNELAFQSGVLIVHETHRSRMLFAAPVARSYFDNNPDLRITLDASHWCVVSESLLQDQQETINIAIQRTDHIHARIGHPEGPQVNDPRAPEWEKAVIVHFEWWDKVVALKKAKDKQLTFLTEFGPPEYMPVTPYSRKPLADQWAVNKYLKELLKKRYS